MRTSKASAGQVVAPTESGQTRIDGQRGRAWRDRPSPGRGSPLRV